MRKFTLIITFLTICITAAFGQSAADSITMTKVFGGYQFYQGENRLTLNQLASTMKLDEQAYKEIKSAKSVYITTMIFSYAGGFMVGYPLGTVLGGGDPNWALAGIGAGLIVVAISLNHSFNKKTKQAIDTYNSGIGKVRFGIKTNLNFQ